MHATISKSMHSNKHKYLWHKNIFGTISENRKCIISQGYTSQSFQYVCAFIVFQQAGIFMGVIPHFMQQLNKYLPNFKHKVKLALCVGCYFSCSCEAVKQTGIFRLHKTNYNDCN